MRIILLPVLLLTLSGFAQSTNCVPTPLGVVGWWRGENNASDMVTGSNGVLVGNAAYGPGMVNRGFVLDGYHDQVQVGNPPSLQLQEFTIELWVKRASAAAVSLDGNGNGHLFGYGNNGYGLYLDPLGRPALTKVGLNNVTLNAAITDTNFHHLAVSKSGSTVVFFIDGLAYSVPAYNPAFEFSTVVAIGGAGGKLEGTFWGTIDEVTVYSRPLSHEEIQAIYVAGSVGKCCAPAIYRQPQGQTGYWGGSATFVVGALGDPVIEYLWFKDGFPITWATNSTLTLTNLALSDAGDYRVVVSNALGSATSSNAFLIVNPSGISLGLYPGVTVEGVVGKTFGIQYTTSVGPTADWTTLTTLTLSQPVQLWVDTSVNVHDMSQPMRFYRVVPIP